MGKKGNKKRGGEEGGGMYVFPLWAGVLPKFLSSLDYRIDIEGV